MKGIWILACVVVFRHPLLQWGVEQYLGYLLPGTAWEVTYAEGFSHVVAKTSGILCTIDRMILGKKIIAEGLVLDIADGVPLGISLEDCAKLAEYPIAIRQAVWKQGGVEFSFSLEDRLFCLGDTIRVTIDKGFSLVMGKTDLVWLHKVVSLFFPNELVVHRGVIEGETITDGCVTYKGVTIEVDNATKQRLQGVVATSHGITVEEALVVCKDGVWSGEHTKVKDWDIECAWTYDGDEVLATIDSLIPLKARYKDGVVVVEGDKIYAKAEVWPEFSLQKVQGQALGCDLLIVPRVEGGGYFCDVKVEDGSRWGLGTGYEAKGVWRGTTFDGCIRGKDFDLFGYVFRTFFTQVHVDEKGVVFSNASLSDEAIWAEIPDAKLSWDWFLYVPTVRIEDVRPSLFRTREGQEKVKPFCIKTMTFDEVMGNITDLRSLTGQGKLQFINTFKEGMSVLDIPMEIISRLGLDMGLLVPVEGELEYVLKQGKLVFTQLHNSYSEHRRSRFYLWNQTESYIDFLGNIHLDIRMQQYVLFKITELFLLSVQGPIGNPKCFLR